MNRSVIKETIERLYMLKRDCPCRGIRARLSLPSPKVLYLPKNQSILSVPSETWKVDEIKREIERKDRIFFGDEDYELLSKNGFWEENMRKVEAFYQQVVEDEKRNRAFNAFISRF